jgi:hypothetical protein
MVIVAGVSAWTGIIATLTWTIVFLVVFLREAVGEGVRRPGDVPVSTRGGAGKCPCEDQSIILMKVGRERVRHDCPGDLETTFGL